MGRIDRAHGLGGEVLVRLLTNNPERLDAGSVLVAQTRRGTRQLTVEASRPHQDRFLVCFAGVADRGAGEAIAGSALFAPAVTSDPDSYWVHDLIGAEVVDAAGRMHGTVLTVVANPASDLLELDTGPLIPLRFATWAPGAQPGEAQPPRLVVDGPAGLLGDDPPAEVS